MTYVEFRDRIKNELRENPHGLSWLELKARLALPHKTPCQTWIYQLESDIGLKRKQSGRHKVWSVENRAG